MTQRIKITVAIEEQYEYDYNGHIEKRTRDVDVYMQKIERENVDGLIAQIAAVVNGEQA